MSCQFLTKVLEKDCSKSHIGGITKASYIGRIRDLQNNIPQNGVTPVSSISLKSGAKLTKIITPKDGSSYSHSSQITSTGQVLYTHNLSVLVYAESVSDDRAFESILLQDDLFAIVEDRNKEFFIIGSANGGNATYNFDSGTDSTGSTLNTLTITCNSEVAKPQRLLNTDYDTTVSMLESLL